MRDPLNITHIEYTSDNGFEIVDMNDIPEFGIEDYDLFDDKDMKKYFESIENLCRRSFHYQEYTKYLRENTNMNECSFYENVSNADTYKIKIHIHHHPFTLYDIVYIVYRKRLANNEPLDEELVAKEVMCLHYNMMVGLIPLSETVHELVHNNYLFIPLEKVYGYFNKFADWYEPYMDEEIINNLRRNVEYSENYHEELEDSNLHILNKNYVYIDYGEDKKPDYSDMIEMMNQRVTDLRNGEPIPEEVKSQIQSSINKEDDGLIEGIKFD